MRMKAFLALGLVLYGLLMLHAAPAPAAPAWRKVPLIDVTDLYHPPQDPGDNLDLIAAYALPEVDLRAVVLDCTAAFRKPEADFPGLPPDPSGPRDPGFIPVTQLNCIFNRAVPCAAAPFQTMKSPQDKMLDAPAFQQQGVELILKTLRESPEPVQIVCFGSARPVAVAFNREAKLFRNKLKRLHLCAGASDPGYVEWRSNVSGRRLVRRADGRQRIVAAAEVLATDTVLPNELRPCRVRVNDKGTFAWEKTTQPTNFQIYDRGNPEQNQRALREALPALYISFVP